MILKGKFTLSSLPLGARSSLQVFVPNPITLHSPPELVQSRVRRSSIPPLKIGIFSPLVVARLWDCDILDLRLHFFQNPLSVLIALFVIFVVFPLDSVTLAWLTSSDKTSYPLAREHL